MTAYMLLWKCSAPHHAADLRLLLQKGLDSAEGRMKGSLEQDQALAATVEAPLSCREAMF